MSEAVGGICSILAGLTRWRAEKKPQFDHNPPFWTGFPLINMEMAKNQICNTKKVENFLQFDWLRPVVFQLNLKYLHVKITNLLWVVVLTNNSMICT